MSGATAAHLIALGFWGGVVLAELLIEAAGLRGRLDHPTVAWLHGRIDLWIEAPLLVAVVLTGALLWHRADWSPALWPKAAAGLAAVLANIVCLEIVRRRCARHLPLACAKGPIPTLTRGVLASAAVGVPFGLLALYLGGARAGWW